MDTTALRTRGVSRALFHFRLASLVGLLAGSGLMVVPALAGVAHAGSHDDLKTAYNQALGQYNNLDLEAAVAVLDDAIKAGEEANPDDPALAPLLVLRAGIIYSNTGDAEQTKAALGQAVAVDYFAQIPIELRAESFQALLDEVRAVAGPAPDESIRHTPPASSCGEDIEFEVVVSDLVDGGQVAFYWRAGGEGEFAPVSMDTFGNVATVTVPATEHNDRSIEYFVYVFDSDEKQLSNKGDQDNPLTISPSCAEPEPEPEPEPAPAPELKRQRFFVNLGLGTGAGIASGTADLSYRQYSPQYRDQSTGAQFVYGSQEYACSVARWAFPQDELPGDPLTFQNRLTEIQGLESTLPVGYTFFGPGMTPQSIAASYNSEYCNEHHPVQTGMAWAPFHIAPEFGFAITEKLVLSVFARLQVVSGSKVYRDNPKAGYSESFVKSVYDVDQQNPEGVRVKPGFAWGVGAKLKYMIGDPKKKFRVFVGGFGGYGTARLRVNMNFANDRNGNSIPDDREFGLDLANNDAEFDPVTNPCTPVWPYNNSCTPGDNTDPMGNPGDRDRLQAQFKAQTADKDPRIDTVGIGRVMLGATVGFHYQIAKNFALFSELQIGGWFPKNSSLLFDLNVGPAITF